MCEGQEVKGRVGELMGDGSDEMTENVNNTERITI